jgi:hypothetical protein
MAASAVKRDYHLIKWNIYFETVRKFFGVRLKTLHMRENAEIHFPEIAKALRTHL